MKRLSTRVSTKRERGGKEESLTVNSEELVGGGTNHFEAGVLFFPSAKRKIELSLLGIWVKVLVIRTK